VPQEAAPLLAAAECHEWVRQTEGWRELGATHITFTSTGLGFKSVSEHIEAIRRYKEAVQF